MRQTIYTALAPAAIGHYSPSRDLRLEACNSEHETRNSKLETPNP